MSTHTRPDIAYDTCELSTAYKQATVSDLVKLNKLLERVKKEFETELPQLREQLRKVTKQLEVEKQDKKNKVSRASRAVKITEQRVAEAIKSDFGFLTNNPQILSLLALFQERDDFEIDLESEVVKPINEETFL